MLSAAEGFRVYGFRGLGLRVVSRVDMCGRSLQSEGFVSQEAFLGCRALGGSKGSKTTGIKNYIKAGYKSLEDIYKAS